MTPTQPPDTRTAEAMKNELKHAVEACGRAEVQHNAAQRHLRSVLSGLRADGWTWDDFNALPDRIGERAWDLRHG